MMKVLQASVAGMISFLFFSTSAYADASAASGAYAAADTDAKFMIGVEGGFGSASVDHSYKRIGATGDGIECGSLSVVEEGIGSERAAIYAQYGGDNGWGARFGFYGAGDSTGWDLSVISRRAVNTEGFIVFFGIGIGSLDIDVKQNISLVGSCSSLSEPTILPAQEYTFQGGKALFGVEKQITDALSWTITGNFESYSSRAIDTSDGFETTIEPRVTSLTFGLVYYF